MARHHSIQHKNSRCAEQAKGPAPQRRERGDVRLRPQAIRDNPIG